MESTFTGRSSLRPWTASLCCQGHGVDCAVFQEDSSMRAGLGEGSSMRAGLPPFLSTSGHAPIVMVNFSLTKGRFVKAISTSLVHTPANAAIYPFAKAISTLLLLEPNSYGFIYAYIHIYIQRYIHIYTYVCICDLQLATFLYF